MLQDLKLKRVCFNLFVSIVSFFALFGLRTYSQTQFTFTPGDFVVVDKINAQYTNYTNVLSVVDQNRYRLTDAIRRQTVAMWQYHDRRFSMR